MLYAREKSRPPIGQNIGIGNSFSTNEKIVMKRLMNLHSHNFSVSSKKNWKCPCKLMIKSDFLTSSLMKIANNLFG